MKLKKFMLLGLVATLSLSVYGCGAKKNTDETKTVATEDESKEDTTEETAETTESEEGTTESESTDESASVEETIDENATSETYFGVLSEDGTYTNEKFGLTLQVPTEWYTLNDEERLKMLNISYDQTIENEFVKEIMQQKTLPLIMAYSQDPSTVTEGMADSFNTMAEKLDSASRLRVKDEEDYFEVSKKQFEGMTEFQGLPATIEVGDNEQVDLNGTEVTSFKLSISVNDGAVKIYERFYAKMVDDYVIVMTTASLNENIEGQLATVVDSIQFQ